MGWAQRLGNLVGVMDLFMFSHSVSAGLWDVGLMVGLWVIVFLVLDHLSSHIGTNTI